MFQLGLNAAALEVGGFTHMAHAGELHLLFVAEFGQGAGLLGRLLRGPVRGLEFVHFVLALRAAFVVFAYVVEAVQGGEGED
jgi:hypothetical protein